MTQQKPMLILYLWKKAIISCLSEQNDPKIHTNAKILPQIGPQPLPSSSFPIHNSLINQSLDAIYSEILKA
jgi:hypothetical protein